MPLLLMFTIAGLLTFAIRFSSIGLVGRLELPPGIRRALRFVPPAVFSAIFVPELLMPGGVFNLSLSNARLLAGLVAIGVAWRTRSVLLTIAAGMLVLWLLTALLAR